MATTYLASYANHPLQEANAKARVITKGYRIMWYLTNKRAKPISTKLFEQRTSDQRSEVDFSMVGLGLAQASNEMGETPFEPILDGDSKETQWIIYKKGYMASREGIADDQYGVHKKTARKLAQSFIYRKEANCAATLSGVFTTTRGFDPVTTAGVAICSTSHNFANGKSNLVSTENTWSNRLAVDSPISYESIKTAQLLMLKTPDREGHPMDLKADCLVVPIDIYDRACEVTKTQKVPYSDENTRSVVGPGGEWSMPTIIPWKWLTSTTAWFAIDKDEFNGFWVSRDKAELHEDMDWNKGIYRWFGYMRGNSDINEPRGIVGTPGT